MQHFRKQCTNGTYNPNFGLKIGVNTPWQVYFAENNFFFEKVFAFDTNFFFALSY